MNETELLAQLSRTDAFAPETEMPSAAWTRETTLAEVRSRIAPGSRDWPATASPTLRGRSGLLVAAAAFVAVLVVGIALLVSFARGASDGPAATVPAPPPTTAPKIQSSTTAPPPPSTTLDAAAVHFLDQMVEEFESGDIEAVAERIRSAEVFRDAAYSGALGDDPADNRSRLINNFALWRALESRVAIEDCRTTSAGITQCVLTRISPSEPFYPQPERTLFDIRLEDGAVTYLSTAPDVTTPAYRVKSAFMDWLPADVFTALQFAAEPARAASLQVEYVELWRAEQGN